MTTSVQASPTIYVHTKRPQWGFGVLTQEKPDRRYVQFEDGQRRTFARGYYDMLEPQNVAEDPRLERVLEKLTRAAGVLAVQGGASTADATTLDAQIEAFLDAYPRGFADPAWIRDVRGEGAKRRLKRHRAPAIAEARARFSRERMEELRDAGRSLELFTGLLDLLQSTDLVTLKRDVRPLEALNPTRQVEVVDALYGLLYGEGSFTSKFNAWVEALGGPRGRVSWALATAVPALIAPERFCPVSPVTLRRQAEWMAPTLKIGRDPKGRTYRAVLGMVRAVRHSLAQERLEAHDLVEVSEFISRSLKGVRAARA